MRHVLQRDMLRYRANQVCRAPLKYPSCKHDSNCGRSLQRDGWTTSINNRRAQIAVSVKLVEGRKHPPALSVHSPPDEGL